jgi:signal transduction histidine kinase
MSSRAASWLAWSLAGLSVAMSLVSAVLDVLVRSAQSPSTWVSVGAVGGMLALVSFLAFPIVGALIASRHPRNPIGWICIADGLLWMLLGVIDSYYRYGVANPGTIPYPVAIGTLANQWLWVPTVGLLGIYLVLLFPNGRFPSRRWRPLAWFSGAVIVLLSVTEGLAPGPLENQGGVPNPFGLEKYPWLTDAALVFLPLLPLCILAAAVSLVLRYRRSGGEVRQQIKWIAFVASFAGLVYLIAMVSQLFLAPMMVGKGGKLPPLPLWFELLTSVAVLGFAGVPVAIGFAVLKYRLYDIDLLINRTLVYGSLTAIVVGLYVLVVGTLSALFQARADLAVSLVATGVVAVLFAPLRDGLQRGVNRLMYGERDDPYAVLSRMGRRLEATIAPKAALTTIVETITQALKVPYVAIKLRQDSGEHFETVAEHGTPKAESLALPLIYQRENVGQLLVAPRAPGEDFSAADRRLLKDLARQVEVAVHAVRLTADLQRSRERLVTTREEERRRLRRDLHDGLGPTLGYLTLGLDTARRLFSQDPKGAERLLLELKAKTQDAVSDVRRLVYDLRPPALDDLGLVAAIRQQAANHGLLAEDLNGKGSRWVNAKNGIVFKVEASESLPSLPAAVEVACYRIAQEAIANASRHSGASSCRVRLSVDEADGTLELEVADDGVGMPQDRTAGVGMSSMRERAEELGGTLSVEALPQSGTRVLARLPLSEERAEE